VRPATLADLVAEAVRLAGEPVLEIDWCRRYCHVRTASGWRRIFGSARDVSTEASIAGARVIEPRTYEAWLEGGLEDFDEV